VVIAISHALRAHEALSRPYALSGFLEVVHRFFEDGVFICHDRSIRTSGPPITRLIRLLARAEYERKRKVKRAG
jgi:hypothetical protein